MKPNYKIVLVIFLFSISVKTWAGNPIPVLTHSPSNPLAGQTVTFSLAENYVYNCQTVKVAPDLDNFPDSLLDLTLAAGFYTASHVYPSPGTYQIGYDITLDEECEFRLTQGKNRSLADFDFGPVGGPFVQATQNGNEFSAPLVIGAPAPIPTMGQWGIIILALMSTIFGVVMIYEKNIKWSNSNF